MNKNYWLFKKKNNNKQKKIDEGIFFQNAVFVYRRMRQKAWQYGEGVENSSQTHRQINYKLTKK